MMQKEEKSKIKKQVERMAQFSVRGMLSYSIIILGALLLIGTVLDMTSGTLFSGYEDSIHKLNEGIFYSCIGLICVVLGLERALDIARIDGTLEKQNELLQSIDLHITAYRQYKVLDSYHDIHNISLQLVERARTNIRSVVYANSPKAPDSWNERVAELLKYKADAGFPVQFDIVICINPDDLNEQFIEATERRFQIFKNKGADMYFHRYIQPMERTIGQDCFIIDDDHLIISFPTILSNKTQKGMFFENQKETVAQYINWFNSYAMFEAMSMKTVIKNVRSANKLFS